MPPKVVSPSRLARYYFQECDRFLRYSATPEAERETECVPGAGSDDTPATAAILEAGYLWEEEVIARKLADKVRVASHPDGTLLRDRIFNLADTKQALEALQPGEYLYQPTLLAVPSFYERYGLDPAIVRFANCRPDLLYLANTPHGPRLRVIDIKASPGLKISHRIQAALYTLLLEPLLIDWGLPHLVDSTAGIWLGDADDAQTFDTRHIRPTLEAFLSGRLQNLLSSPAAEADWHFYFRCEWCTYFKHCREEMRRTDDVSRLPMLSSYAKKHLATLTPPVRSLSELEQLLADPARIPLLDGCSSLEGKAKRLEHQVLALRRGRMRAYGGASLALPRGENIRLFLTLQTEPVSGHVYAYGVFAQGLGRFREPSGTLGLADSDSRSARGTYPEEPLIGVASDGRKETIDALERGFIRSLLSLLKPVHEHNRRNSDFASQKSLQTYVFDSYERVQLTSLLLRRIGDTQVSALAVELFFYFQQPDLLQNDNQPADQVFFPTVVLVDVISRLLALPVETNIRLVDAAKLLRPAQYAFDYQPDPRFEFELSNQMRSDAVHALWHHADTSQKAAIEQEIRARLFAANSILTGLRETLIKGNVPAFAWPPKFKLPAAANYRHPLLARLAFMTRFESAVRYVSIRSARVAPLTERLNSGNALRLTFLGDDRFQLDASQAELPIDVAGFPNWLMHEDTDAGHRAALGFDDYSNRSRVWVPKTLPLALAGVQDRTVTNASVVLRLDVKQGQAMPNMKPGDRFLLSPRFTDFTSDHVLAEFEELDQQPRPYFVDLIQTPQLVNTAVGIPRSVRQVALDLADKHGMTPSQRAAFAGMIDTRLRLVWGPPGTGKTHFLALALLCLAEANRSVGLRLRVVLTGFTHASIDNCLAKIRRLQQQLAICVGGFDVGKIGGNVKEDAAEQWLANRSYAVLGGTVWAIRKSLPVECAEAVVIDEGSQFRVPEAAIAARRLAPIGRLVVAGDDRQLPPIIEAEYPPPAEGEPLVHRSLFECLRQADPDERYTSTLLENWRMNDVLCLYPAAQVYVPEYRSATPEVAARRLRLAPSINDEPLLDALLDPAFSLVVCVVDGVKATAENRVEAELVGKLVARLRNRLLDADGMPYREDRKFWADGVFVVSPHHVQITAVRRELAKHREWTSTPFVDTVDKMQGQECDAVVVTYGVADAEYALAEKTFIYSMNRLNVAITRARVKTIVVLSRPLIEPPLAAYEDDEAAAGIAFMQGLVRHAATGDVQYHDLGDRVRLTVSRLQ